MSHSILFDIETWPIDGVERYVEKPKAPGNYKSEEAIARFEDEAFLKAIGRAALKPDLGRICAIAWMQEERDTEPRAIICRNAAEEKRAITQFLDDLVDGDHFKRLITFGGHRFDQPFVMRRAMALRILDFPLLRCDRHSPHLDLYRLLTYDDVIDGYSLQFYLRRYAEDGLVDPCVVDDVVGADVPGLAAEGRWDLIEQHCKADVLRLYALAAWMGAVEHRPVEETPLPF
jgi:Predicted 3'-5' exonuclease related to the exonuclease domain of PolB